MERGDNGKFRKSASPAASTSGEDVSRIGGIGENAYEEPVESLATPVAVMTVPALPSDTGTTGAEDAPIKNDDSAEGRPKGAGEGGAGEGGDGTNDEVEQLYLCWLLSNVSNNNRGRTRVKRRRPSPKRRACVCGVLLFVAPHTSHRQTSGCPMGTRWVCSKDAGIKLVIGVRLAVQKSRVHCCCRSKEIPPLTP